LGISGGLDSTVLAHLLKELGYQKVILAHLNHELRGEESTDDEKFVKGLGQDLGYEVQSESADIDALCKSDKLSVEAAGRRARQQFWERLALEEGISTIFLAQHADDQIETVLLQFFRSSGRSTGMRAAQRIGPLVYLRPLLELNKEELRNYATDNQITWREDSSNATREFTRNRVRLDLIPQLPEIFGREVTPVIYNRAAIATDEENFFDILTEKTFPLCLDEQQNLKVESLEAVHVSLQRRIARFSPQPTPQPRSYRKQSR